jgi:hypothetical protein
MTEAEIKELHERGWEMASHSHTHQDLATLSESELNTEFQTSIDEIKRITGERPKGLIFPFNSFDQQVLDVAETYFEWVMGDFSSALGHAPKLLAPELQYALLPGHLKDTPASYASAAWPFVTNMHHEESAAHAQADADAARKHGVQLTNISNMAPFANLIGATDRDLDLNSQWSVIGGTAGTVSMDTATAYHGHDQTLLYDNVGSTDTVRVGGPKVPVEPNEDYSLTVAFNTETYNSGYLKGQILFQDETGSTTNSGNTDTFASNNSATSGWERFSESKTAPAGSVRAQAVVFFEELDGKVRASDMHLIGPTQP